MMRDNGRVTSNDIEMMLFAWKFNKIQNFQKVNAGDEISEAIFIR